MIFYSELTFEGMNCIIQPRLAHECIQFTDLNMTYTHIHPQKREKCVTNFLKRLKCQIDHTLKVMKKG